MKRKIVGAMAMVMLMAMLNVPAVQAQQRGRAEIPFAFQAGDKALPAGTYLVSSIAEHALAIRNVDNNDSAMMVVQNLEKLGEQSPKLVFRVYGDHYFLCEVWNGSNFGMSVPAGREEKELRMAKKDVASSYVVIALR